VQGLPTLSFAYFSGEYWLSLFNYLLFRECSTIEVQESTAEAHGETLDVLALLKTEFKEKMTLWPQQKVFLSLSKLAFLWSHFHLW